ncbi:hypothetical protein Ddc_20765 [Ditylenchus destructor]|nr:hypothetical protein Ddc_20765 [Ditylenchus destructor]
MRWCAAGRKGRVPTRANADDPGGTAQRCEYTGALAGGEAGGHREYHTGAGDQYDNQAGNQEVQAEHGIQTPCTNGR